MIDSEATVKRFYKEKNYIRLQPENDSMDPIISDRVANYWKSNSVFRKINNNKIITSTYYINVGGVFF